MLMLSCLDPAETFIGVFSKRYSVADTRRTSPSNFATFLPFIVGFGSVNGGAACGHGGCVAQLKPAQMPSI
eukprot:scaffold1185_cov143-Skeletonema_menzelii.AAC.27